MAKVPGMFNGGVPPDLEWDESNPPMKNTCSNGPFHNDDCDGSCIKEPMLESEVELLNEHRRWARIGLHHNMVVTSPAEAYKIKNQMTSIFEILENVLGISRETMDEIYRRVTTNSMRLIREANEEQLKRQKLGLPASGLLGPNGRPMQ